jgi:hypothetical protein
MTPNRTIAALLLCLTAAGCSASASVRADDPGPAPATATATATPATTDLDDGRHYARLTAFDAEARTVTVDVVQFFSGDAAVRAAVEDGRQAEDVANDTYIRNESTRPRTLPFRAGLAVTVNTLGAGKTGSAAEDTEVTHAELAGYLAAGDAQHRLFWFDLEGGVVVRLHEQYLP